MNLGFLACVQQLSACLLMCALVTGCSTSPQWRVSGDVAVSVKHAWVDGRRVEYISTDVSDAAVALAQGINHVPRLADALHKSPGSRSLLERVYTFPGGEQWSVFQSAPFPAGPRSSDRSYSPLWRMVTVKWKPGSLVRELRSEEDILKAEDSGLVEVTVMDIVINCPVLRTFELQPTP